MTLLETIRKQVDNLTKQSRDGVLRDHELPYHFKNDFSNELTAPKAPSHKSSLANPTKFEETYKHAYSHGLEAIYALENIDVKSICQIERQPQILSKEEPILILPKQINDQYEFDLGDEYRGWMPSFLNREPIQVLGLSRHAEKCLLEHGKQRLEDLIGVNLRDFVFFKGMGQGHLDEIQQKLYSYLDGRTLQRCYSVDFSAWIRSLVAALDRKKTFVGVHAYQLTDLFSLTPIESVEVNRLTLEKRQEWMQEALDLFRMEHRRQAVSIDMGKVTNVFIKPWIRQRLGFATEYELTERLQRVSENPNTSSAILHFFSSVYFDDMFPLSYYLYQVDEKLYCADETTATFYREVIKKACSYFYNARITYPLSQLISFLEREFAYQWQGFPEGFIKKVLQQSPHFRVRKSVQGHLEIRLA